MGNQSQAFDQLSSHLSIFFALVRGQHVEQERAHFSIELDEVFPGGLGTGRDGCNGVFLDNGDIFVVVDQKGTELGEQLLDVLLELFKVHAFYEVGEGSGGMADNSGHRVIQQVHEHRHHLGVESGLEVRLHIISNLANAVAYGISDLRIRVFTELNYRQDNRLHILASI